MSEGIGLLAWPASLRGAMRGTRGRTLIGGAIGHFIEWYDWAIYGFLAGVFAGQMFPSKDPATSLIASFAVFAIGFIGRPLGAVILSPLADRYGRRGLLSATIIMAGAGSLLIAVCPTYSRIGIAAPLVIVAARLLQGFSGGGEYQIAISFLNEHASDRNRALSSSPQQLSIGLAILFATGVASLVTRYFAPGVLAAWGWRTPFALGAVMSVYGLYLRSGLKETPAFERIKPQQTVTSTAILASIAEFPKETFVVFVVAMNSVQYYIWMIFLPIYANVVGGLDRSSAFLGGVAANIAYCIGVVVFAAVSDRIGRKPLLIAAALGFLVFTYPLLSLVARPALQSGTFMAVAVIGAIFISFNNAVLGTVLAELFPTRVRTSGIGIPYALCAAVFGGTAPMVATWLQQIGGPLYISLYVMAVCVVTLATHAFLTPETRGRSLD
jgi:MHS family alpha-ketoglutarate permease-like MFS transporter